MNNTNSLAIMLASGAFIGWGLRQLADYAPAPIASALPWVTLLMGIGFAAILFVHHAVKGGQQ